MNKPAYRLVGLLTIMTILAILATVTTAHPLEALTPTASGAVQGAAPTPTGALDEDTLNRLALAITPTEQMQPGETRQFKVGVLDCCYLFRPVETTVSWSVVPNDGATIDAKTGVLTIDPATPPDTIFTVQANVENGRRIVSIDVYIYTPDSNPLVGFWNEFSQYQCGTGLETIPQKLINELEFRADGTFTVTWVPFEIYHDYWGEYVYDLENKTLELRVDSGNYEPAALDLKGTFAIDEEGTLILSDLWLGNAQGIDTPPNCGHRFVRQGNPAPQIKAPKYDLTPVVIALQNLPRGFVITGQVAQMVMEVRLRPANSVPLNSFHSIDEVIGRVARTDIVREVVLQQSMFFNPNDFGQPTPTATSSNLPTEALMGIPPGLVEYPLAVSARLRLPVGLQVGDSVDILTTMPGQDNPSETAMLEQIVRIGNLSDQRVVLWVEPATATLLDSAVQNHAAITLIARNPLDSTRFPSASVNRAVVGDRLKVPNDARLSQLTAQQSGSAAPPAAPAPTHIPLTVTPPKLSGATYNVVVARRDLPRGYRITQQDVTDPTAIIGVEVWPEEVVPMNIVLSTQEVIGKLVRSDIPAGAPLLVVQLVDQPDQLVSIGSDLTLMLPQGGYAVPLKRSAWAGLPDSLHVLDTVSLQVQFKPPTGTLSRDLLTQAVVLENDANADIITLLVPDRDTAMLLVWAEENAPQ